MAAPRVPRGICLAACLLFCCCCTLPAPASAEGATTAAAAAVAATAAGKHTEAERQASLQRLFQAIDLDADGQLKRAELERYAAASLDMQQEGWAAGEAVHASQEALDGPDAGATVSAAELTAHLRALMQVLHGSCLLFPPSQRSCRVCSLA